MSHESLGSDEIVDISSVLRKHSVHSQTLTSEEESLGHQSEFNSCIIESLFIEESKSNSQILENIESLILESSQSSHPLFSTDDELDDFHKELVTVDSQISTGLNSGTGGIEEFRSQVGQ